MADDILDEFQEDHSSATEMIAVKYFFFESEARVYAARLEAEGIPSFVSNSHAITAVPLGSPGIGLHIRKQDYDTARPIILRMDQRAEMELADEDTSYRDADHGDILYQQQLTEQNKGSNKALIYLIAIIIIAVLVRVVWRAFNPGIGWNWY